jgi:hypothetical protein
VSTKREFLQNLPSLTNRRGALAKLKDMLVDEQAGAILDEVNRPVRLVYARHDGLYTNLSWADLPGVQFSMDSERVLQNVPGVPGGLRIAVDPEKLQIELEDWGPAGPTSSKPAYRRSWAPKHKESVPETKPDLFDMLMGLSRRAQLATVVIYCFMGFGYVWGVSSDNMVLAARFATLFAGWLGTGGMIRWLEIG